MYLPDGCNLKKKKLRDFRISFQSTCNISMCQNGLLIVHNFSTRKRSSRTITVYKHFFVLQLFFQLSVATSILCRISPYLPILQMPLCT
jgi:hypothetical protein